MELLKIYFEGRNDVAFAFLFGSSIKGKVRKEGDIDIAVYFRTKHGVEWEESGKRWEAEARIALDMERLLNKEVDLVVLNRAKAVLADEIIRKGAPITIKDTGLLLDFLCIISDEAEYVREWMLDYYKEAQDCSREIRQSSFPFNMASFIFDKEADAETFSEMAKIRNTLAHRYLDIRWQDIKRFIQIAQELCPAFIRYLKKEASL